MVVVFGAGGFIGTYLVDILVDQGFQVLAVDNSPLAQEYFEEKKIANAKVDITKEADFGALPSANIRAVVNLACLQPVNVHEDRYRSSKYIDVNVIGTTNILDYCCRTKAGNYIYTISHRGVQGAWVNGEVITETCRKALKYTGEFAMFSISECAAMDCIEHYSQEYQLRNVVLRIPPVYGYGPHLEGYRGGKPVRSGFMTFIDKARSSEPIELWGDPERGRDIVYVKDVVSAVILSIRNAEARGLYNISSGEKVTLRQEAEEIVRVFSPPERPSEIRPVPLRQNSVEPFQYDISKARSELQWLPRYPLRKMLEDIRDEMALGRYDYLVRRRDELFRESSCGK